MAKSTGLKAIAYELGVSVNTVSRALRDCKDISEHTKEIIRKKAYELGYIQSTVANFLKKDEVFHIKMPCSCFKKVLQEFPLWLSGLRTQHSHL